MSEPRATFDAGAKKHLGQHFLHEKGIIGKIVQAVDPKPGDRLVEIGPGQGAITFPLLDRHGELTVIEFDRDLIAPLTDAARAHGTLTIVHRDVLQVDFTALAAGMHPDGGQIRLVGNLPYNLSSPILFHALDHAAAIRDMHFMLQKEVVDRMAAEPGSKVYGRLSVMLQAYCAVTPLFKVPPGAFRPAPKVHSAVVRLAFKRPEVPEGDMPLFEGMVRGMFTQRRKTLGNALRPYAQAIGRDAVAALTAAGIDPVRRPETLALADLLRLTESLKPEP